MIIANISGGQRQKLDFLRCLLSNKELILLDEAFSAIDVNSKEYFKPILLELIKNKTCIMIDHNFQYIESISKVIFIDKDGVVHVDSHNKLLSNNSDYQSLFYKHSKK